MISGVVVCRYGEDLHAGVFFQSQGAEAFLHMCWENRLSSRWDLGGQKFQPDLDPAILRSVGARCRQILKARNEGAPLPYGINYQYASFNDDGLLELPVGASGLTCATFALSVFESVGVRLIDMHEWPIRTEDDIAFAHRFQSDPIYPALLAEAQRGVARVRPNEVAACCELYPPAPQFHQLKEKADELDTFIS